MTVSEDKRCDKRFTCKIPIVVSSFNSKHSMDAVLVDHCMEGVSFISNDAFLLGTAIVIRIVYCTLKDSCGSDLETLPSIRIGEVKWCRKLSDETSTAYEVGIKYYPQVY
jgi:hypothetical protein